MSYQNFLAYFSEQITPILETDLSKYEEIADETVILKLREKIAFLYTKIYLIEQSEGIADKDKIELSEFVIDQLIDSFYNEPKDSVDEIVAFSPLINALVNIKEQCPHKPNLKPSLLNSRLFKNLNNSEFIKNEYLKAMQKIELTHKKTAQKSSFNIDNSKSAVDRKKVTSKYININNGKENTKTHSSNTYPKFKFDPNAKSYSPKSFSSLKSDNLEFGNLSNAPVIQP